MIYDVVWGIIYDFIFERSFGTYYFIVDFAFFNFYQGFDFFSPFGEGGLISFVTSEDEGAKIDKLLMSKGLCSTSGLLSVYF